MEKKVVLSLLLALVIFVFVVIYAVMEPARLEGARQRQRGEAAQRGAELYALNCVSCHGDRGQGIVGPRLNRPDLRQGAADEMSKTEESLTRIIARGRGSAMPAWGLEDGGPLNSAQVHELVTFIMYGDWEEVAKHAPGETPLAEEIPTPVSASPVDKGKKLFQTKGCAGCHAIAGKGGSIGPDLSEMGQQRDADWLQRWLKDPKAVKSDTAMPNPNLSNEERDALVEYLLTLK